MQLSSAILLDKPKAPLSEAVPEDDAKGKVNVDGMFSDLASSQSAASISKQAGDQDPLQLAYKSSRETIEKAAHAKSVEANPMSVVDQTSLDSAQSAASAMSKQVGFFGDHGTVSDALPELGSSGRAAASNVANMKERILHYWYEFQRDRLRDRQEQGIEPSKEERAWAEKHVKDWLHAAAGRGSSDRPSPAFSAAPAICADQQHAGMNTSTASRVRYRCMLAIHDASWRLFDTPISRKHGSLQFWRGESDATMEYWMLRTQRLYREMVADARISARQLASDARLGQAVQPGDYRTFLQAQVSRLSTN